MQVVILSNEIKIGTTYYPFNTIYFKSQGNSIFIYNLSGELLIESIFSDFIDSNNIPYTSISSVLDSLKSSFI